MKNIAEMLHVTALRVPDKVGISHEVGELTWAEVYNLAQSVSRKLKDAGVSQGDRVGIYIDHKPEQVIAIFATAMADATFSVISQLLKPNQIKHQVADADIGVLITTDEQKNYIEGVVDHRPVELITVSLEGADKTMPIQAAPTSNNVPTDVACIIYTSGSTGNPKGVVVPGRTLLDGARIVTDYLGITEEDTILSVLPYSFDYGLNQLLSVVYRGGRIVIRKFTFPQEIVRVLVDENVTGFAAVPSMWGHFFNPKLLDQNEKPIFKSLRYITTAGGKHPKELLKKLDALFPTTNIIIMYGLTESFRSTYLPASELHKRYGSIGKPVPEVDIMVVNEDGEPCKPGEKGELIHRGAFVTYGYLNDPDLTREKFIELQTGGEGCLPEFAVRSGDIVSLDEDGFIYFHERADTQIKISGYRISPSQVEEVAISVPDVKHAAAFGIPDKSIGEAVCLAYSSHSGEEIERQIFLKNFKENLPSYAIPKVFRFYDALPHTPHGKTDYSHLKLDEQQDGSED